MTSRSGFSLIELIIVIGIVGILAAIGGLGGSALLQASRLNSAVSTIEMQVASARRLAKETDQPVELRLEVDGGTGLWAIMVGGRTTYLEGATVASGPTSLTLDPPYGTYAGAARTIQIQVGNRSAQVDVTGVFARTVVSR